MTAAELRGNDRPVLAGISHGTSSVEGHNAIVGLLDAVAATLPEVEVVGGYVDVEHPNVPETLALVSPGIEVVVVPLLLSAGYHVHVDLAQTTRNAGEGVCLAATLGPDERLVRVLAARLVEAGYQRGDHVIMAAAGSSDPRAILDCEVVAAQLAVALSDEVTLAFHSAHSPVVTEAIAHARAHLPGRRIIVSSYLLAPGYFQSLAVNSAADVVTESILPASGRIPESLVELVVDRYLEAVNRLHSAPVSVARASI